MVWAGGEPKRPPNRRRPGGRWRSWGPSFAPAKEFSTVEATKENGLTIETGQPFRTGFVAIVGAPNVGKSTLLNQLLKQRLSIVSKKPQTTRNRILGIYNGAGCQILFFDTPGFHQGSTPLDRFLTEQALKACSQVDLVLVLAEARGQGSLLPLPLLEVIARNRIPALLAINKIDLIERPRLLPLMENLARQFPFREIVPVSALKKEGLAELVAAMVRLLPEGPPLYPEDLVSDLPERFFAAELIREQVLKNIHGEIPYGTAVCIESFKEKDDGLVVIEAALIVEKESHKKIIVGLKGQMIRRIGEAARAELEKFLGTRVFLQTFVRVEKNWTRSQGKMDEFGYHDR
ncbi:MAG: GTPase Era [Deltaproteobacteria bacterium]|nr:GTPase Era [Deltaproteobacteria bacterium]